MRAAVTTHAALQPLYAASASAGVLWELAALQRHYHPHVAAHAKSVAARSGAGSFSGLPCAVAADTFELGAAHVLVVADRAV